MKKLPMPKTKPNEAKQDMFTTTISLTPELHQKLKHLAVDLGVPFRDLVREALEGLLGQHKAMGGSRSRHEPIE
jgi:hypothetical protein